MTSLLASSWPPCSRPRRSPGAPWRRRRLAATIAWLASVTVSGCPQPVGLVSVGTTVGGADVSLSVEGVRAVRGEEVLFELDWADVGFRSREAFYDMQYGMFLIEEAGDEPWVSPDRVVLQSGGGPALVQALLFVGEELIGQATIFERGDGQLEIRVAGAGGANRTRVDVTCRAGDHFAGLGAQSHDVDHRGQRVPLWVSEQGVGKTDNDEVPAVWQLVGRRHTTHIPMPAYVLQNGTAVAVESTAYAVFDFCAEDEGVVSHEVWEGELRFHLFVDDTPVAALGLLSGFVGRPRLPAPWMHAPWNDAIFGTDAVRDFAARLREHEIPSSAIWSEDWRGGEAFGGGLYRLSEDWGLDEELYPGFQGLLADLRDDGFAHQVYFNTFLYDDADVFSVATERGYAVKEPSGVPYLFGAANADFSEAAILDLTNPDAVEFVKGYLRDALALGALGWMADFAEWMPVQRAQLASGEDPALVHNRYPVLWQQVNQEVLEEEGADDAIVYARSGHLFGPGVTQVVWAGDQRTSFDEDDGLPTIIPMGLGLAATGYLFYAHDIAGYQSSTNDPATKELFYRWTQLGAFTPVMRTHHGTHTTANWRLFSDEETTLHWKRYASLHIRLVPYARALALRAVDEGRPMWLPLGLVYPAEEEAWPIKDQVLFGDALLVAPVVTEGATSREVWFPPGRWAPAFADGDVVTGPTRQTVAAPLEEIPVFIRAGGIVPLTAHTPQTLLTVPPGPSAISDLSTIEGDREVWVGLGAPGAFTEESGATYTLEGTGTDASGLPRVDGAVEVTGNGVLEGDGFTLTLTGHPEGRTTRVILR